MKKLNMLAVAGTLALTLGLTGCGSDDKSDSSSSTSSSSNSSAAAAGGSSSAASQDSSSSSSADGAAAAGGVKTCKLDRKGQQVDASVVGLSCDDASAIWNKFSGKDSDMATATVEYNGEKFNCAVMASGATTSGACSAGTKAISLTSV